MAEILKLQQIETSPLPGSCVPQILIRPFTSNWLFKEHRNQAMDMGELQLFINGFNLQSPESTRREWNR